jgi:hypothetical protein
MVLLITAADNDPLAHVPYRYTSDRILVNHPYVRLCSLPAVFLNNRGEKLLSPPYIRYQCFHLSRLSCSFVCDLYVLPVTATPLLFLEPVFHEFLLHMAEKISLIFKGYNNNATEERKMTTVLNWEKRHELLLFNLWPCSGRER